MTNGTENKIELKNVLLVPELMCNLISVSQTRQARHRTVFKTRVDKLGVREVIPRNTSVPVLTTMEIESNGQYEAVLCAEKGTSALFTTAENQRLWHERLGHASRSTI